MVSDAKVDKKDRILMQLAHYFITVENYTPIVVKGVKNEIWLENIDAPYRIVRINANYLHNNEQLDFDLFKIKNIVRQVKRKTLSLSVKTLNILIDVGSTVELKEKDKIDSIFVDANKALEKNKKLNELYPTLKDNLVKSKDGIEFVINITNDINVKTEKDSKEYEKVFRIKNNWVTSLLMCINILMFIVAMIGMMTKKYDLYTMLSLNKYYVTHGEIYRLITSAFMHENIFHLIMNMYALFIIGGQVESYIGKVKYTAVYFFSAITGSLLSCVVHNNLTWSLGASGAIFGLMGALVYFGYHYRLYLDNALKTQIIPIVFLNLAIGFMFENIDNGAHIGGLIGGLFMTAAVGIKNRTTKQDTINGIICSTILIIFLSYILFFIH
ncbi:MAG: rhomboid family intramembrane serine protease [Bacilli bacterium]|nr:rhomboid family intramembrane serine protease [Bacilli bacterium]